MDELAHRNVPGSRHERRWQDVLELLDAGIDVYTTINIQHLESLNDVVHRITGVRVGETVPDLLFDRLRDIKLIDLPPRELIERLQQGKVYVPEQASQALHAFFSPSNLTALRELAMQTAADRVDSDLRESQLARGLPGTALRRRVLVAIDGRGQSEYLVRVSRRLAERRDAPWTVVTVQSAAGVDEQQQRELDRAFALARLQLPHHHDQAPATIPLGWFCSINLPRGFFKPALARGCEHVVGAPPNGLGLQPLVFDQSEHRGARQPLVDVQRLQQLDQAAQPHPPATGQDGIAKNGGDERAGLYAAFLAKALQKGLNGL